MARETKHKMKTLSFLCVLLAVSLLHSVEATRGTLGLEGGVIGAILVVAVAVIGIGIGLGVCLYRNDLCSCGKNPV